MSNPQRGSIGGAAHPMLHRGSAVPDLVSELRHEVRPAYRQPRGRDDLVHLDSGSPIVGGEHDEAELEVTPIEEACLVTLRVGSVLRPRR